MALDRRALEENLATLAEACAVLLTFLLPLKLGTLSGVPEMPMAYWSDPLALLVAAWPSTLLAPLAGVLLVFSLLAAWRAPFRSPLLRLFALLWAGLGAVSLLGFVNASVFDFPLNATAHTFGVAAYALSLCLLLERRPELARWLAGALAVGAVLSAFSGFYQHFSGFEATRQFAYEQELKSGVQFLQGQFKTRLEESRISADFTICNAYAGYLLLVAPLLVWLAWSFASKVEPPKLARPVLVLPLAGAFGFLLLGTGSRAALLAAAGAVFLLVLILPFGRKLRYAAFAALPFLLVVFAVLVKLGRGFGSMTFRFDYYLAAFKMMLARPFAGTGWGDFFHEYMRLKLLVNDEAPHSPHNFPLHFGSQTGVLGFLLALAVLALPIAAGALAAWRRRKASGSFSFGFDEVLLYAYSAWALHSLADIDFETPGSVCVAVAVASLLLCRSCRSEVPPQAAASFKTLGFSLVALGVLAGALLFGRASLLSDIAYSNLHSLTDFRFMSKEDIQNATPDKVLAALKTCQEISPRSPFPWASASDYFLAIGRPDEALSMLREAIARSPERASFRFKAFKIESSFQPLWPEAWKDLEAARSLFPSHPEYKEAERLFKETLAGAKASSGNPPSVFNQPR